MNTWQPLTRGVAAAALLCALFAQGTAAASAQSPPDAPGGSGEVRQSTPALVFDSAQEDRGQGTLPSPEEGVDRDGDGIPTLVDFCPDSPPGTRVDETGCAAEPVPWWVLAGGTALVLGVGRLFWAPFVRRRRRKQLRESRFERPPGSPAVGDGPAGPFQPPGAPIPWTAPPMPPRGKPTVAPAHSIPDAPGSFPLPEGWPPKHATPDPATSADLSASAPPTLPTPPVSPSHGAVPPHGPPPVSATPPSPEVPPGGGRVGFPAPPDQNPRPTPPPQDPQSWKPALPGVPAATPEAELPEQPLFQSTPANPAGSHSWSDQPLHYEEPEQKGTLELIKERPFMALGVALVLLLGGLAVVTGGDDYVRPPGPVVGIPANSTPTVVAIAPDSVPAATGSSGIPSALRMVDGDAQRGRVGQVLPTPVAVQVEDENGEPIAGVAVMFEATVGGGSVSPIATQTDSTGIARSSWTLGPQVVKQYVVARVAGSQAGVAFEADVSPGIASRVAVIRGDSQTATPGEIVEEPVVVRVESEDGRPLEGVLVRFASDGGGAANPVEGVSDTLGEVSTVWTLGATGDSTVLRAEVADAPGIAATIVARAAFPSLPARAGVAVGGTHSCALSASGSLSCWGGNQSGQLGSGGGRSPSPRRVSGGQPFADVSAGLGYTCGVSANGVVFCWGDNANAQLGDGTRAPKATPRAVAADVRFRRVAAGNSHTCAISREGSIFCWGSNSYGQLGDGTRSDRDRPTPTLGPGFYEQVAVGWFHSCSLTPDGRASCWGRNAFGQLGDGTTNDHSDPAPVGGSARYRELTAGGAHTCGLGTDQVVYCWGQNNYGQLGDGGSQPRTRPTPVTGGPWRSVSAGGVHTCALDTSGAAFCWGRNTYGQLGDGTTSDQATPQAVQGGVLFATIRASGAHTCGSTASGERYCWGYNVEGQLGDGTRENRRTPTRVSGGE